MPLLTTVIDDKSPLILYDATWTPGSSGDDPLATSYYLGTFTKNNVTNGSMTFDFNGTAVWVYGANRGNHGTYTVQVDSDTYSGYNGVGNNLFQQSLFNLPTLSQETHTLKLTNTATGGLYVDIDMIVWQSEIGNANDQLVPVVIQDTDSRFNYQGSTWSTTSSTINFNLFNNGSGHVTGTYGATVSFTFTVGSSFNYIVRDLRSIQGEAVTLFGTSGPNNGPYSVQLDGGQAITYNATTTYPTNYGVVIYHADNLGSGSHQIILTNLPALGSQPLLSVDYAQLWTISNSSTSSSSLGSANCTSASQSQNLGAGPIAGLVVAVVAAVIGFGAAMFFYRRWKALLPIHDGLYRDHTSQQQPAGLAAVGATAFSSSLEARSNRTILRSDSSTQAFSGGTRQLGDNREAQHNGAATLSSGLRDSHNTYTVAPTTQSLMDEGLGHRPLPDAPGGGLSLSAEFPKLTGAQHRRSLDVSSIAISDVPPNYNQVVENTTRMHT